MGTGISEIADLFMSRVNDYRLTTIFSTYNVEVFNAYVEPWLLDSIVDFDVCDQDLNYTPTSGSVEGNFDSTLNLKNKIVLSRVMTLYWLEKEVNDVLQMNNLLQDHDFKTFAQSQNLKAKQDYLNLKREEISQLLVDYGYKGNNWKQWQNQNFGSS